LMFWFEELAFRYLQPIIYTCIVEIDCAGYMIMNVKCVVYHV